MRAIVATMHLHDLLAPNPPRDFPGRRWLRVGFRSLHLLAIAGFVGGVVFGGPEPAVRGWLHAVLMTGGLLFATDLYRSCDCLRELRGAAMVGKLVLLGIAVAWPPVMLPVVVAIVLLSAVVSHMPSQYRHWVLGAGPPDRARQAAGRG